ncbi:MAG: metalloprotease PmbA [Gammaproteobacteria bacterium]|jgi:PmbA protein|nr:metalloprotease PmbA [Chromatiales bacterium]MCP4926582.1 metalloprotease PmbA [Gammaproteobacteria bacterium]MDP7154169.1 metalloprotease PmbA [Gammaproteobacteria bacterium]MDP7296106.1 metalloprotease PmbA [Gammaproteobacteria bacterium]MDP7419047.1 metalloprotease PmbA [Gammaproteobacteria bacterium]
MTEQPRPDIDMLSKCVEQALQLTRQHGASAAEASANFRAGLSVTARLRAVETLEYHRDQGLGVTVFFGQRKGNASTSDLSTAAIEETVRRACGLAQFTAEDECAGLADAQRLATEIADLDLYHPWSVEPHQAIDIAIECEAAALDSDKRIGNSEGATLSTSSGCSAYGNTNGFLAGYRDSHHSLSCAVIAQDAGQMERDYEYTVSRRADELTAATLIGRQAAERSLLRLGARKLDTRKAPVLLSPRIARGFFAHLIGAISGGSLYRKSTFLLDSLDTQVLAECVSIEERPHLHGGLASSPFDAEGVETRDRCLVERGVLQGYILGSYYARKLGMQTTGNAGGAHNLLVDNTDHSFKDLLATMDTGLLVNEVMGQGVNPVTGDYSRGAAGFWVAGGEIQYPVSEITIAGNLRDMYRHIAGIGNDTDLRGGIRTGSVLIEEMMLAGN